MKILVDAFGGDNAPLEILKGCIAANGKENDVEILLVGNEELIKKSADENSLDISPFHIYHAQDIITMEDEPGEVMKSKKNSSMAEGLRLVANGECDAFISAGNSGAMLMGATLTVKRIKGIKRPAFAGIMPSSKKPFMLIDSGANIDVRAEMLCQFGIMGSIYMKNILGVENPRVGLVNVGTEEHKGRELQHEAFALLKKANINFIGNIEARDIPAGIADVVVADGFTGNIIAKMYEGVAKELFTKVKGVFFKNFKTKIAALMLKKDLSELKEYFDYNKYGGAAIMGVSKPIMKTHGSANEIAVAASIKSMAEFVRSGAIEKIAEEVAAVKSN